MTARACLAAAVAALCLAAGPATAHDSWLSPVREGAARAVALEFATGTRFPAQEFGPAAASLARASCVDAAGQRTPLQAVQEHPRWLDLAPAATEGDAAPLLSCWAQLQAAEIELQPRIVDVYFADIRATAANRAAWADLQRRGIPWRERYRKNARIELASAGALPAGILAAARRPVGLDLEIVILGDRPVIVGEPVDFQVLRGGEPLAGFAVELVSERNALGVWRQTDAQGRVRHRLPFGGRWLLRGTDLRLSAQRPDGWDSQFATLAFEPAERVTR